MLLFYPFLESSYQMNGIFCLMVNGILKELRYRRAPAALLVIYAEEVLAGRGLGPLTQEGCEDGLSPRAGAATGPERRLDRSVPLQPPV